MWGMTDDVIVRRPTAVITDSEGRKTVEWSEQRWAGVHVAVSPAISSAAETSVERLGDQDGMRAGIVVAVPNEVWQSHGVRSGDQIIVPTERGEPIAGTYTVRSITQTRIHRRVWCERLVR